MLFALVLCGSGGKKNELRPTLNYTTLVWIHRLYRGTIGLDYSVENVSNELPGVQSAWFSEIEGKYCEAH